MLWKVFGALLSAHICYEPEDALKKQTYENNDKDKDSGCLPTTLEIDASSLSLLWGTGPWALGHTASLT